jgi:methanogenic corrinoid protein MtbC1
MNAKPFIGIRAVEHETCIPKETLRMWERRYGFPNPKRSQAGDRFYSVADVAKLRLVKRLVDRGRRPGSIVRMPHKQLESLAGALVETERATAKCEPAVTGVELLEAGRYADFGRWLKKRLHRDGLHGFILDVARPLTLEVGALWECGDLAVFQEHAFTVQMAEVLRSGIASLAAGNRRPAILLTTLAHEQHGLGLLMLEALLSLQGATCISLGTQMPIDEIAGCVAANKVDVVALSFSAHYPPRMMRSDLRALRAALPKSVEIWAGGAAVAKAPPDLPGISMRPELEDGLRALDEWRRAHKT